jgi:hypothetical protein
MTWQILPKPSWYSFAGTAGVSWIWLGERRSEAREGCTLSIKIIGVVAHAYRKFRNWRESS